MFLNTFIYKRALTQRFDMLGECLYIPFSIPQIAIYFPMTKETLVCDIIVFDGRTDSHSF